MNVASQALSKELYELSDWYDTSYVYARGGALALRRVDIDQHVDHVFEEPPAYDLGFLIRKLPKMDEHNDHFELWHSVNDGWVIEYSAELSATADTPEDAIARLAIELIKQGILPATPTQTKEEK